MSPNLLDRRIRRTFVWALLFALGCGGGCGEGGCGGCGGGGGCLAPIPGGFVPELRRENALGLKITESGFAFVKGQAAQVIGGQTSQSQQLDCTDASQRVEFDIPFVGTQRIDVNAYICDLTQNDACEAADNDPALRVDEAGHGKLCTADLKVSGFDMAPVANADGTVDVLVNVDVSLNTGRLPIRVKAPVCGGFRCTLEVDTDRGARPSMRIPVRIQLRTSPPPHNLLQFDLAPLPTLESLMDNEDIRVDSDGGSACRFGCDAIDVGVVKRQLLKRAQEQVTEALRNAIDSFRCQPCDPDAAADACVALGAKCDADLEVCITGDPGASPRTCPPVFPGVEGRSDLALALADVVAGGAGVLDLSIAAGGPAPAARVQAGGLVVGMVGGSATPERSLCVPFSRFQHAPASPLDFDAAAAERVDGLTDIGPYDLGFSVSDLFMDEIAFNAWAAGAICAQLGQEQVDVLSTGLFSSFLPSLGMLAHGEDVPMLLALRPRNPPQVTIGRGTTTAGPNGTRVPKDPLLTFELKDLGIDFYAQLEERQVRLFTLVADVKLPMALEFDPVANTILPVLANLDTLFANVRVENSEMLAEDSTEIGKLIAQLVGLVQPQIGGALEPIEMPDANGMKLEVKGARGVVPNAGEPGFQHMVLFMKLGGALQPLRVEVETSATLAGLDDAARVGGRLDLSQPRRARIGVRGSAPSGLANAGYEFSYRVDGGLWTAFVAGPELEVSSPLFLLDGRHSVDVRARLVGEPGTVDRTPERVSFVVDEIAPRVSLQFEEESGLVRTIARDLATTDEALLFRYRAAGADWGDWGGLQAFEGTSLSSLEVEVKDGAGHVARASWGRVSQAGAIGAVDANEPAGCTSAGAGALALLALLLRARRRSR